MKQQLPKTYVDVKYGELLLYTDIRWLSTTKWFVRHNETLKLNCNCKIAIRPYMFKLNFKIQGKQQNILNFYRYIKTKKHNFSIFQALKTTLKKLRILKEYHI